MFSRNYKKKIKSLNNLLFIINIIIFFLTLFFLKHSHWPYFFFSIISLFYFHYTFINFNYYVELYLSIFIYLGFWLKSSIFFIINRYSYTYKRFPESPQSHVEMTNEYLTNHISELFNISSLSILTIFLTFYFVNNFILPLKKNSFKSCQLYGLKKFFINNKFKLYFLYIFFSLSVIFLNIILAIVYRGKIELNFDIIQNVIKIFLFFGILTIGCLFLEFDNNKNIKNFLFYNIIQGFLISISIHSRAMLFEQLAIISSVLHKIKLKYISIIIFLFLIFFFIISLYAVSFIREKNSLHSESNTKILSDLNFKNFSNKLFQLGTERWVGIDGLSNVIEYKEKSFSFFVDSLKENDKSKTTFYEKNFFKKKLDLNSFYKSSYVPGFIAFLYYHGSLPFLIISLIILLILLVYLERVINFFSRNSVIVTNYLSFLIVWRIIHFGVYPIYTIYYYLVIILFISCIYIFNKYLEKYYD